MRKHLFKQFVAPFTADFVVLGMSGSYKTLSRRLEAMKTIQQFSRQQIAAAALALALLAAVSIVPWRLVAQERAPASHRAPAAKAAPAAKQQEAKQPAEPAKTTAANTDPQKLIVGTWRGKAASGEATEWVFQKNGSYQELFAQNQRPLFGPDSSNDSTYYRELGKWRIIDDILVIAPKRLQPSGPNNVLANRQVVIGGYPLDPGAPGGADAPAPEGRFRIVRLDDSLMRLQPLLPESTDGAELNYVPALAAMFYHRVDTKEVDSKESSMEFDPSLPAHLRQVAVLAELTPRDASKIAPWFPEKDHRNGEPLHWEVIERIVKARDGRVGLAILFGLDGDEVKPFRELLNLCGSYPAASALADEGQLAPQELSAVKKVGKLVSDFAAIQIAFSRASTFMPSRSGATPYGAAEPPQVSAERAEDLGVKEAAVKLGLFLDELDTYLKTIEQPQAPAGAAPGAAGFGMGDHAGGRFGAPPAARTSLLDVGAGGNDHDGGSPGDVRPPGDGLK
jgi:hypothetical protein